MSVLTRLSSSFQADFSLVLCKKVTPVQKLCFVIEKYLSILMNKRNINYLGRSFSYDTRITPQILEFYPQEITELDKYIDFSKSKTVLDIGANVGQWAFTVKAFFPELRIYSFEPNPVPYRKLEANAQTVKNWNVFNKAVGKKNQKKPLYYTDDSTVGGSFYRNVTKEFIKGTKVRKIITQVVNLDPEEILKMKLPKVFDVVKIDVEGMELEVLKSINSIKFKYLIIEIPIKGKRNITPENIEEVIRQNFKKEAKLLYIQPVGNLKIVANAIYKLN